MLDQCSRVVERMRARSKRGACAARCLAERIKRIDAPRARIRADLMMKGCAVLADLAHIAHHQRAAVNTQPVRRLPRAANRDLRYSCHQSPLRPPAAQRMRFLTSDVPRPAQMLRVLSG